MSTTTVTSLDGFHARSTAQRADELPRALFDGVNADDHDCIDGLAGRGGLSYDVGGVCSRTELKRYSDLRRSYAELRPAVERACRLGDKHGNNRCQPRRKGEHHGHDAH
jgi:hypothetical protein